MSERKIITNNVPRDVVEAWQIHPDLRKDFDYLDWDKIERGEDSASFIRYKGEWYDLGDFQRIEPHYIMKQSFPGWDGFISDTVFSGILLKWAPDTNFEQVIMGRYYT